MKKLHFDYEMRLQFTAPVQRHSFSLRCIPKNTAYQQATITSCRISPSVQLAHSADAFGNLLISGYVEEPHDFFSFQVSGSVVTAVRSKEEQPLQPLFRYPTVQTALNSGTEEYLAASAACTDPLQKALAMSRLLFRNFCYRPRTTSTATTAQQALDQGCGVCQDYAHILIALCRLCHVPARYAAGFMLGEGVTHAWAEVYDGEGWIGIDPTNNRMAGDGYIKICDGRDAADCIIDKGVFFGNVAQHQTVHVKVTEEDAESGQ